MAEKKPELDWDDVSVEPDPIGDVVDQAEPIEPHKSVGTKAYQRFWGTDVDEDPLELIRLGSQLVGGIGGAMSGGAAGAQVGAGLGALAGPGGAGVGAAVGAGVGAVVGGFAGGFAGTVAPEVGIEAAEFLGIVDKGKREKLGLTDKELDTVVEGEMILDMLTGGVLTTGRALTRGATKTFTGLLGLTKGSRTAKRTAEFAAEHGVNMLPVQVGTRTLPRGFVSVLGKFPLVAGPLKKNINETNRQLKEAFENLPASIAPIATLNDVSHSIFMDAKTLVTNTANEMSKNYADIYKRADATGAKVIPSDTVGRINSVIADIASETPSVPRFNKKAKAAPIMEDVKNFLTNDIGKIFRTSRSGNTTVAPQTLTQMGTLIDKIDTKIASVMKGHGVLAEEAADRLSKVKQAIQIDMYTNIEGAAGHAIGKDLQGLDQKYAATVADLFDSVSANKFAAVRKGGLMNMGAKDVPTRVSMDNLTDVLMKGDMSELDEIHRLVTPETFKKMAAYSISKQVEDAFTEGGKSLNLGTLTKSLGLDAPKGARYKYTEKMLKMAGGLTMKDLDQMVEVADQIGAVVAPDASMFIARRGVMGGAGGIVKGLVPSIGVGTAAGAAAGKVGVTAGLMGGIMFLGGGNMIGRMISDPALARPLHKVLDKEASRVVRRGAYMQLGRIYANRMVSDGEFDQKESLTWRKSFEQTMTAIENTFYEQLNIRTHRGR